MLFDAEEFRSHAESLLHHAAISILESQISRLQWRHKSFKTGGEREQLRLEALVVKLKALEASLVVLRRDREVEARRARIRLV